jgi:hypothetical protein
MKNDSFREIKFRENLKCALTLTFTSENPSSLHLGERKREKENISSTINGNVISKRPYTFYTFFKRVNREKEGQKFHDKIVFPKKFTL